MSCCPSKKTRSCRKSSKSSSASSDVAYAYVNESGTDQEVASNDRFAFSTTTKSKNITVAADSEVPEGGTTLEIVTPGLYEFTLILRGTTVAVEGVSPTLVASLGRGTYPSYTEYQQTEYSAVAPTAAEEQLLVAHGFFTAAEGDLVQVRNLSGAAVTLSDDDAISASLTLELIDSSAGCNCNC